jgi:predicted nucleic acid-binding protein
MKPVFVDTSALIALGNERGTFYQQASNIRRELVSSRRIFLTTSRLACNEFARLWEQKKTYHSM